MRRKGVLYDVGREMGASWRPVFQAEVVRRELEIIRDGLHCNSVRICGRQLSRVLFAAETALSLGLETWICPELWDRDGDRTAAYLERAAEQIEPLRARSPAKVVLSVGSEATLFCRGIVPGRSFTSRVQNPSLSSIIQRREHNAPLNALLTKLVAAVRTSYHGKLTYASLAWEGVNWAPFDIVGVDHYRSSHNEERYLDLLKPAFRPEKPVVITEFGYDTMVQGPLSQGFVGAGGAQPSVINTRSQSLHQLPILGRLVRPRLNGAHVRDERFQARKLVEQLKILDGAGVDGAFVFQFLSQLTPYSEDPRFDLDMASSSLVKYLERRKGTTYPDMPWEPKESFRAVAEFYAAH